MKVIMYSFFSVMALWSHVSNAQTKFERLMQNYPESQCLEFIKKRIWLGQRGWEDVLKNDGRLYFYNREHAKSAEIRIIPIFVPSKAIHSYDTTQSILDYLEPRTDIVYLATISKDGKLLSILESWHQNLNKGPLTTIYEDFEANRQMTNFKEEFLAENKIYFDLVRKEYCSVSKNDRVFVYDTYLKKWLSWNYRMKDSLKAYAEAADKFRK